MLADDELREALIARLPDLEPDVEAELDRLLTRADSLTRRRRTAYVVGLVAAAVVVAGLVLAHDWRSDATKPDPVDNTPVRAQAVDNRGRYGKPAALDPGRYRTRPLGPIVEFPFLQVELDIPAGWGQDDVFAFATGPGSADATRRIDLFGDVRRVAIAQCNDPRLVTPGPTTLDLATTLTSLGGTGTPVPTPTTLDGYAGYLLRVDDSGAGGAPCGAGFVLREHYPGAVVVYGDRGWTNLVWILDVGDTRVVINASHGPDATPAQEAELVRMVESVSFIVP